MSDEKPCGRIHPLPCAVDKDCRYIELEKKAQTLIEEWRKLGDDACKQGHLDDYRCMHKAADELENLIEDQ